MVAESAAPTDTEDDGGSGVSSHSSSSGSSSGTSSGSSEGSSDGSSEGSSDGSSDSSSDGSYDSCSESESSGRDAHVWEMCCNRRSKLTHFAKVRGIKARRLTLETGYDFRKQETMVKVFEELKNTAPRRL